MATSPTSGPGGGGDSTGLTLVTKTLTDAQVKALPSQVVHGFTLVAAQGAGTAILPVAGMIAKYGVAYTNVNAAADVVIAHDGFNGTDQSPQVLCGGGGLLDTALDETATLPLTGWNIAAAAPPASLSPIGAPAPLTAITDLDLILWCSNAASGNFTGGGAGNSVVVTLLYIVVDV